MESILRLPNETLSCVFRFLGIVDLRSLVRAQRACRRFHAIIQGILSHPQITTYPPELNAMINRKFSWLFHSTHCLSRTEYKKTIGRLPDPELPFRRLPWARKPVRDRYLRQEASWRSLSVTWGSLPVTQVEVIKDFVYRTGMYLDYRRVEVPPCGLTMGFYFDLLLSKESMYGDLTKGWELMLGKRLGSNEAVEGRRFSSKDEVKGLLVDDAQSAVLLVDGFRGCGPVQNIKWHKGRWRPEIIGPNPPKFQTWQEASQNAHL